MTLVALSGCTNPPAADARDTVALRAQPAAPVTEIDAFIIEASQRFRIPERWIRAVMRAESAGNARAISHAGAMGLMQIMPGTWAELRAEHGFGTDPFDRRENILAGTAYLRAMYDRFGAPGFLAAYNAGPGRYAEHLRTGRPLPRETRRYMASLSQELGFSGTAPLQANRTVSAARWQDAPLFAPVSSADNRQQSNRSDSGQRSVNQSSESRSNEPQNERANSLFVSRSTETDR
ncbi:MAG: lytic transglycosylase domain-containing protein [Pseudomonadota bacterium]